MEVEGRRISRGTGGGLDERVCMCCLLSGRTRADVCVVAPSRALSGGSGDGVLRRMREAHTQSARGRPPFFRCLSGASACETISGFGARRVLDFSLFVVSRRRVSSCMYVCVYISLYIIFLLPLLLLLLMSFHSSHFSCPLPFLVPSLRTLARSLARFFSHTVRSFRSFSCCPFFLLVLPCCIYHLFIADVLLVFRVGWFPCTHWTLHVAKPPSLLKLTKGIKPTRTTTIQIHLFRLPSQLLCICVL